MGFVLSYNGETRNTYAYPKIEDKQSYIAVLGVPKGSGPSRNIKSLQQGDVVFTYPEHHAFILREDGIEDMAVSKDRNKVFYEPSLSPMFLSNENTDNISNKLCQWPLAGQSSLVYVTPENAPHNIDIEFEEKFKDITISFQLEAIGELNDSISFISSLNRLKLKTLESFQYSRFLRLWIKFSISQFVTAQDHLFDFENAWTQEVMESNICEYLLLSGFHSESIKVKNYNIKSDAVVIEDIEILEETEEVNAVESVEEIEIVEPIEPIQEVQEVQETQEIQEVVMSEINAVQLNQDNWSCDQCGHTGNTGKFCKSCGVPKKEDRTVWECLDCGTQNNRNFCYKCGRKKPIKVTNYRCVKCQWTPEEDETFEPCFCPECGDKIEDDDIFYTYI